MLQKGMLGKLEFREEIMQAGEKILFGDFEWNVLDIQGIELY